MHDEKVCHRPRTGLLLCPHLVTRVRADMSDKLLDAVIVGPTDATYSVIWLHGLGADGHDFESLVPELHFKNKHRTRFIFPHAPARPVTLNQGYVMPAWFDIIAIDEDGNRLIDSDFRNGNGFVHTITRARDVRPQIRTF